MWLRPRIAQIEPESGTNWSGLEPRITRSRSEPGTAQLAPKLGTSRSGLVPGIARSRPKPRTAWSARTRDIPVKARICDCPIGAETRDILVTGGTWDYPIRGRTARSGVVLETTWITMSKPKPGIAGSELELGTAWSRAGT